MGNLVPDAHLYAHIFVTLYIIHIDILERK